MSGEPPEGVAPPGASTLDGEPRTVRLAPVAHDGADPPSTERLPEMEGPPEIHRFLSPPPPAPRNSEVPPPSSGGTRRRSRRTVKTPHEAPASAPPAPPATEPLPAAAAAVPETPNSPLAGHAHPPETAKGPPLQFIPPTPPVPSHRTAPTLPAVPRPAPKAGPSAPAPAPTADGGVRRQTPPPPPAPTAQPAAAAEPLRAPSEETFEVIRPMRIISIDASPPSVKAPPAAPPPVAEALAPAEPARPSRPPMPASPEIEAQVEVGETPRAPAVTPAPPPAPRAPKPPVVEEVEAIEDVEEPPTDVSPPVDVEVAADAVPRAARTDEIEPILVEEDDRISDFDVAVTGEMAAVEIAVDLDDAPKPKKPPPPPPKRQLSGEMPAVVPVASPAPPPVAPAATTTSSPPTAPPEEAPRAAAETPAPAPVAAAESPKPPPPSATEAPKPPPPPAITTAAAPAAAAQPPASVQTLDLGRKRQKPWWEEIFGDDFIRTLEKVQPKIIRKECDFIEDRLGLEKGAIMLDLACGSGAHAVELASRGYNVVGYDLSLAMLARAQDEAQERGQKINFLQGDMREMAFEEAFDGMYSWSTSFGYFDDEKNVNVLSRVHRGLRQGGMFLLDVINRDYVCPRQPSLVWFEGDGCVCMDEMHVDFFSSRLRVKRTVMFEDGRSRECEYAIRLYGLHELGKMLHDTGFKVVEVTGHPAHPGVFFGSESPRIIVLAERG